MLGRASLGLLAVLVHVNVGCEVPRYSRATSTETGGGQQQGTSPDAEASCASPCSNAHGQTACVDNVCVPTCESGYADCDGNPNNGCESALNTTANCLACGKACANDHGSTSCTEDGCVPTCAAAYESCDGTLDNGCEASLNGDPDNCGTCGHQCAFTGAVAGCAGGQCTVDHCLENFLDCDRKPENGCEIDVLSAPDNCGACGLVCKNEHGDTKCVNGTCVPTCLSGYGDCDGLASNGCETNTNTDTQNCRECHNVCAADGGEPNCVGGVCGVSHCSGGVGDCDNDGTCETRLDALNNCGHCGTVCSSANGTPACAAGADGGLACTIKCEALWGDCDSKAVGCETPINTQTNCGKCGTPCSRDHMKTTCATGTCLPDTAAGSACTDGYNDCNTKADDGCESDPDVDVNHCGGCPTACVNPHGTVSCVGGACRPQCDSGWGVCSGDPAGGCTVDITTASHCGASCTVCTGTAPVCVEGQCRDDGAIAVHTPAASGGTITGTTTGSLTLTHTLATGPGNRRVVLFGVVLVGSNLVADPLTVTYAGGTANASQVAAKWSGNQAWSGIYLLGDAALPAAGPHTVTISRSSTSSGDVFGVMATALEFTGVDQDNPVEKSVANGRNANCGGTALSDALAFSSTKPWGFDVLALAGITSAYAPTAVSPQVPILARDNSNVTAVASYQGPMAVSPASFSWSKANCNASSHVAVVLQRSTH